MDVVYDPDTLDIRRRWAEMFCTNPVIWQGLANEYRMMGRISMADYCERHAVYYSGKREGTHEISANSTASD